MNSLESYIETFGLDPLEVMNVLQAKAPAGTISDNCVDPSEVANAGAAVFWVHQNRHIFQARVSRKTKR